MVTAVLTAGVDAINAASPHPGRSLCDVLAARLRSGTDGAAAPGAAFSALTAGPSPPVELAAPDAKDVGLGPDPAADTRIQFEKRFRAEFGAAEAMIKDLRSWDNFDVLTLPGSRVHMLLTASGPDLCESRIFFRTTPVREAVRLPDPPAGTAGPSSALCQNLGGWGYLARVDGVEAFLEYRVRDRAEVFRIVPLTDAGWETACTFGG